MSRSRRHTPISGWTGVSSEKEFKQQEHKRERSTVKATLTNFLDDAELPHPKKYGNRWAGPKDGRGYFGNLRVENKQYYEEMMRK